MSFDVNSFMDLTVTDANDTKRIPVPIGEYIGVTGDPEFKQWQGKADPTKVGVKLTVPIKFEDPAIQSVTGLPQNTVTLEIMLDTLPSGGLDMGKGKNIGLGKLRDALGKNDPGAPFNFRNDISGRTLRCSVVHEEFNGDMFAKIKAVAKV
jgi:hypothetical protein